MLALQQIREALQDRTISKVSRATGLHPNTVRKVRNNPHANPTHRVLLALSSYLEGASNG
jgi:hypothetical protein